MKKALSCLLAVFTAFCSISLASAENVIPESSITTPTAAEITSSAAIGDVLYMISGNAIISQEGDSDPEVVLELDQHPAFARSYIPSLSLISDEQSLYLLDPDQGKLFIMNEKEIQSTVTLDLSGLAEQDEYGTIISVYSPVIMNDSLYLIILNPYYMNRELYCFPLKTGSPEMISTGYISPFALIPYRDGQLLVHDRRTYQLYLLNTDNNNLTDTVVFSTFDDYGTAVVYNDSEDRFCYLSGTKMIRKKENTSETADLLPFDIKEAKYLNACLWNGRYTVSSSFGLYVCDGSGLNADTIKLDIWLTESYLTYQGSFSAFMAAYPNIRIETHTYGEEIGRTLTALALSKDENADLFLIPSFEMSSHEIFQHGFAAPIRSDVLQKAVNNMYPQIRDYLSLDNKLYGFPAVIEPAGWSVRPELMDQAGISSLPVTMNDYADMMTNWYDLYSNNMPEYQFSEQRRFDSVVTSLIHHYLLSGLNENDHVYFNTPEFRQIMEKMIPLKELMENAYSSYTGDYPSVFNSNDMDLSSGMEHIYGFPQKKFIAPPVFRNGQKPVMNAHMFYFSVSHASTHQKEAELYLAFLCSHLDKPDTYTLYPDIADPVETPYYSANAEFASNEILLMQESLGELEARLEKTSDSNEQNDLYDEIAHTKEHITETQSILDQLDKDRWLYSPDVIQSYKNIAEYLVIPQNIRVMDAAYSAADKLMEYFNGTCDLDTAISRADNILSMIYKEDN